MAGAVQRVTHGRMLAWESAALLRMEKLIPLDQYTGQKPAPQPEGTLDMHLRAGARGIKPITLKQYLATKAAS